jgi:hypothetical protein
MELTEKDRDRILLKWSKIEPKTKEEREQYMIKRIELLEKKRKMDEELNSI